MSTYHHHRRDTGRTIGTQAPSSGGAGGEKAIIAAALGLGLLLTSASAGADEKKTGAEAPAAEAPAAEAPAAEAAPSNGDSAALGFHLDLYPTVASAANGKLGFGPQVWLGVKHARLRLAGARLEPPDALAFAGEGFTHAKITTFGAMIDYTFGPHFDGFWLGTGFEIWDQSIEHEDVDGKAEWITVLGAVGAGYIWRLGELVYLEPGVGALLGFNPRTVSQEGFSYDPPRVLGSVSLKLGVMTDL